MTENDCIQVIRGNGPVVIGAPHGGGTKPPGARKRTGIKSDLRTDVMARELCRTSEGFDHTFSSAIALLHRSYLDLNRDHKSHSSRSDYWQQYHQALRSLLSDTLDRWQTALFIDLHGCKNSHGMLSPKENEIYLGTQYGALVPQAFRHAYQCFQESIAVAGYSVAPPSGFEENDRFRGGFTVRNCFSFIESRGDQGLAIQIEIPMALRVRSKLRCLLVSTLSTAMAQLAEDMLAALKN
jgi:N-formylglutamate amidohydrolase